jgi:RNA polymerase sigma-70 factor (ECF subfamily)
MSFSPFSIEKNVIINLRNGDWNSFKEIYLLYKPVLQSFVFRYVKNQADSEEIVQDVFTGIWEQRQNLKEDLSFRSFVFTITKNKIIDYFRKTKIEKLYKNYISNYIEEIQENTQRKIQNNDLSHTITRAIDLLPEKRKAIFILSKKFELSRSEIASFLNISENTVKNQLQEAIQFLRENLKKENC